MPRGRHRQSPSLHRLLPPAAVAAVGLACAGGAWLVGDAGFSDTDTVLLRGLTAAAAVAAVTGAALARRWDRGAGRRVGELKARLAGAEWRAEERQAELEGELEESRELREKLETRLRAKRAELARLRSEHAALLRRYAQAESGRASALEGRRQLALEAAEPARALTAGATDHRSASGAPTSLTYLQASEALRHLRRNAARQRAAAVLAAEEAARASGGSRAVESAGPAGPGAPAAAVPPPREEERPQPAGRFDFFGAARKRRAPAREPESPGRDAGRDAAAGQTADASGDEPGPEDDPGPRGAGRGPVGKVVDLADEDAGDLDITELRGAVS
ncbi:hypothetical protein [Streptomyces sp. JJ36]|uniref:hypothetical protein n=1 Tax=Streptomyces sp. JJ36 TaxID=2736645 RepID=UPI001F3B5417|nr:hypothetical protein [Streptomyces sp. JJ36]MCF6523655.1 hypothetical protein [Streptomyces sp. JJ36]